MQERTKGSCKKQIRKIAEQRGMQIFIYAILFRLMLYAASVFLMTIVGEYQNPITFSDFLEVWKRWDASAYLRIAQKGYRGYQENGQFLDIVFYPLYPWLIKMVAFVVRDYRLAGMLISTICYGIGSVYFDKLMILEFGEEEAENGLLSLSVFPFSFFFGSIMTESLFFALMAAFFYYLRKHEWGTVAFVGFFACLTKVQGMLLALAVIGELFYCYHGFALLREKKWKQFGQKIIWQGMKCVPMTGGIFLYLGLNYLVTGNAFQFLDFQKEHWANSVGPVWNTVKYLTEYMRPNWYTSTGMGMWVPEFLLFFVYLAAIGYGCVKKLRSTYLIYLIAFFILTYSSTWLISGGRYTLSALPLFMLAGKFYTEHKGGKKLLIPFSFALMMIYLAGHYQWKQIM